MTSGPVRSLLSARERQLHLFSVGRRVRLYDMAYVMYNKVSLKPASQRVVVSHVEPQCSLLDRMAKLNDFPYVLG